MGCDQGGSIRMPGACGMKPAHDLGPCTGIMPIESAADYAGPSTGAVEDNAVLLEVLAGSDGLDPRQREVAAHQHTEALTGECRGLRIGVVAGGFGTPVSESDVDEAVRAAAGTLAGEPIAVPATELSEAYFTMALLSGRSGSGCLRGGPCPASLRRRGDNQPESAGFPGAANKSAERQLRQETAAVAFGAGSRLAGGGEGDSGEHGAGRAPGSAAAF